MICPDRQGQGCRNGRTVFLQRRHKLPEHSTPPEDLQCRTLCTCRAQATVPECRRTSQRQCGRAETSALPRLRAASFRSAFPSLADRKALFPFDPRFPIKLSGSFNRRGLSVAWLCSIYSAAPLIQSVVSLFDTQAPCLCRARRSHSHVAAIFAAKSLPCLVGCLACSDCHTLAKAAEAAPISGLACDPLEPIPKVAIARCTDLCLHV